MSWSDFPKLIVGALLVTAFVMALARGMMWLDRAGFGAGIQDRIRLAQVEAEIYAITNRPAATPRLRTIP